MNNLHTNHVNLCICYTACYKDVYGRYGTIIPRIQAAYVKEDAQLLCLSTTITIWRRGSKVIQTKEKLFLYKLSKKDHGDYTCTGTLDRLNYTEFTATGTVLVGGKYNVSIIL